MSNVIKKTSFKLLVCPFLLVITSCGIDPDLARIREFSKNADLAQEALLQFSGDFYKSCLRSARYKAVNVLPLSSNNKDSLEEKITTLENRLITENSNQELILELQGLREKLGQLSPTSDRLQDRRNAQENCNQKRVFTSSVERQIPSQYIGSLMTRGNDVIVLYLKKLGAVASDDLINLDNEFNSLKTNAQNISKQLGDLIGESEKGQAQVERVGAGIEIVNFILTQILEGERRETLKEAILAANEPLKIYAEGLQLVTQRVYIDQFLTREENNLDNYYTDYIQEILDSNTRQGGNSVVPIINTLISLDNNYWNSEKDKIQERREWAYSYIKVLKTIVEGHNALASIYSEGKQPSKQSMKKILDNNEQALKEFIEKSKALNSSKSLQK